MNLSGKRLCLVPQLSGVGGMVSFQARLMTALEKRGISVTHHLDDFPFEAVLVIGGTRQIRGLGRVRQRGIPVVQRLDGRNWIHRKRPVSLRHSLRAEYGNFLLGLIRNRFADRIVYQSHFSQAWWERAAGRPSVPTSIIYNGVDLALFTPFGASERPTDRCRMLLVEGSLRGGYELGMDHALELAQELHSRYQLPIELAVAGQAPQELQESVSTRVEFPVRWEGLVPQERIPFLDRSAHVLFSADLNPACPNAVIEALACGLPVAGYATGALGELVDEQSGALVPYGGDPWQLDSPDTASLAARTAAMLADETRYRAGARARAEAHFDLEVVVDAYLNVLLEV